MKEKKENRNETHNKWNKFLLYFFSCIFLTTVYCSFTIWYCEQLIVQVRNCMIAFGLIGLTMLFFHFFQKNNQLRFPIHASFKRFFICYTLGLLYIPCTHFLPQTVVPVMFIAIILSICSNEITGLLAYCTILYLSFLNFDSDTQILLVNLIVGLAAIFYFYGFDLEYNYKGPLISSIVTFLSFHLLLTIFEQINHFHFNGLLLPFINCFLNILFILLFLKYFSYKVVHENYEYYKNLNQADYPLLLELKKCSPSDYMRAVHTAYMCEIIANSLHLNVNLCKAGGYYHRIQIIDENKSIDDIISDYKFPKELVVLIKECQKGGHKITTKEAGVVMFTDAIINSVIYWFQKYPDKEPDYEQLISITLKKKLNKGIFDECPLTLTEYNQLMNTYIEEKAYYDFLH